MAKLWYLSLADPSSLNKVAFQSSRSARYAWDSSFTHKKLGKPERCRHSPKLVDEMAKK